MSTTLPPTPLTPDQAYTSFKAAEGQLVADQAAQANAQSAFNTAQLNLSAANSTVTSDVSGVQAAGAAAIASIQGYLASLPTPPSGS
jgi:hypothetical protein